jgi:hypothetical protein
VGAIAGLPEFLIAEYRPNSGVSDTDQHDDYVAWFIDCGERMRKVCGLFPPDAVAALEKSDDVDPTTHRPLNGETS